MPNMVLDFHVGIERFRESKAKVKIAPYLCVEWQHEQLHRSVPQ